MKSDLRGILDYFAEVSSLKKTPRQGWRIAGAPVGLDMVASHITIVAHIAYLLARMEQKEGESVDPAKCVLLAVFHDDIETRLGERDKVSTYYLHQTPTVFSEVMDDQINSLPEEIGRGISALVHEANSEESPEAAIVKDADILEASLQAKLFDEAGYTIPKDLLNRYLDESRVTTVSAKELMTTLKQAKNLTTRWVLELFPQK